MKKLIATTAIILLGTMANIAMAAKPPINILLTAGPVLGDITCDVHNNTDKDIDVLVAFCVGKRDGTDSPVNCAGFSVVTLFADQNYGISSGATLDSRFSAMCEVTYLGRKGDITGVTCGSAGCVRLRIN